MIIQELVDFLLQFDQQLPVTTVLGEFNLKESKPNCLRESNPQFEQCIDNILDWFKNTSDTLSDEDKADYKKLYNDLSATPRIIEKETLILKF